MAVGTNIGNTYRGQQGTGFATVVDYNPQTDLSVAQMKLQKDQLAAQEKMAKEAKLMSAYSQMSKIKPDNWYHHDEQISGIAKGMLDLGGSILARGEDPFTSASKEAQDFQRLMVEYAKYNEYSKQFKSEFEDIQKTLKSGEKIKNWDEIVTYMTNPDIVGLVNGDYGKRPNPIFAEPEISTFKAMNEYWDKWRVNNKERIPTMDDAKRMAEEITNDPTLSQGFASVGSKFRQRYDDLPDEQKESLSARGGRLDGYQQYVAEQMYALSNPNFNTEESILKLAANIKTSLSRVDKDGKKVTRRYSNHTDKDLKRYIDSELQDGAVQREVEAGKYGDPGRDIAFNRRAAVEHYLPTLKKNISTEYSEELDKSGAGDKKAIDKQKEEEALARWEQDFSGVNGPERQEEAIAYLYGSKAYNAQVIRKGQPVLGAFFEVDGVKGDEFVDLNTFDPKDPESIGSEVIRQDAPTEAKRKYYDEARKFRKRRYGEDENEQAIEKAIIPGISPSSGPQKIKGF